MRPFRQISYTLITQTVCVLCGALSGLLVVRSLEKAMYAEYAFLQTIIALGVGLASFGNTGACLAMMRLRGEVALSSREVLGVVWRLNRVFVLIAYAAMLLYWLCITCSKQWFNWEYLASSAMLLYMVYSQVVRGFNAMMMRCEGAFAVIGMIDVVSEVFRLLGFGLVSIINPSYAFVFYIAINLLASVLGCVWFKIRFPALNWLGEEVSEAGVNALKKQFSRQMRPLLFPGYFSQLQGVFTFGIIALIAPVTTVAEFGAMGRLMLLMVPVDKTLEILLYPRLALVSTMNRFMRILVGSLLLWLLVSLLIIFSAMAVPNVWVWLLGSQYGQISNLIPLILLSAAIERIGGMVMWSLIARGHTINQAAVVVIGLVGQVLFLLLMPVSTTLGALLFNLVKVAAVAMAQLVVLILYLRRSTDCTSGRVG